MVLGQAGQGTRADGWPDSFPQGLEDVSTYPVLIEELLRRGWSEEELQSVLRGNLLRVFRQVEQVSWAGQKGSSAVGAGAGSRAMGAADHRLPPPGTGGI